MAKKKLDPNDPLLNEARSILAEIMAADGRATETSAQFATDNYDLFEALQDRLIEATSPPAKPERRKKRSRLAAGNRYTYPNFSRNGFVVKWFTFAKGDGLPGVAIEWFGAKKFSGFYPFPTEREFWQSMYFKNAVDAQ